MVHLNESPVRYVPSPLELRAARQARAAGWLALAAAIVMAVTAVVFL